MSRTDNAWAKKMKQFMALLQRNDCEDAPQTKLLDEAEKLCQNLQHSSSSLEKLVKAMEQGRHWGFLLSNIHIVRASVHVHIRSGQYDVACKLVENCGAMEKKELVQLWNEIHYHKTMEKYHKPSLTSVQKFRCRKRNPPPASLCPDGVKSRNYPKEVRWILQRFAVEMTTTPNRQQRDVLAHATNLQPQCIYNWFANYRRRQKTKPSPPKELNPSTCQEESQAERTEGQKSPAQNTDQPSFGHQDGLHVDTGLKQMELPLVSNNPGWEQIDRGQVYSSRGTFMLPGSILQSSYLEDFGPSLEFRSPIKTEECMTFYSQTEEDHGRSLGAAIVESRWRPSSTSTSLWMENSSYSSCILYPTQQWSERLSASRIALEATSKADQYTIWSLDASCVRAACCRMPPSMYVETRMETVRDQAVNEGLVLSERQLGSLEVPMLCSSTPRCPVVSLPDLDESQSWTHEQMWREPSDISTLQAAWLLCELSCSNR
ncbi:anomalous homeobox protein [Paroedura picta]|uniref:anomalous homeobox protein n=1 Tax=Paroedura picta TaxID=143630 RepID=UPI0040576A87